MAKNAQRHIRFSSLALALALCAATAHAERTEHRLKEGEYLYVSGVRSGTMIVEVDETEGQIRINDILVYRSPARTQGDSSLASHRPEVDPTEIPFLANLLVSGVSMDDATSEFWQKADDFERLVGLGTVSVANGEISEESWLSSLKGWTDSESNVGVVQSVELNGDAIYYSLYGSSATAICSPGSIVHRADLESDFKATVRSYTHYYDESDEAQFLIVSADGGTIFAGGAQAEALVDQIEAMASGRHPRIEAVPTSILKRFGF